MGHGRICVAKCSLTISSICFSTNACIYFYSSSMHYLNSCLFLFVPHRSVFEQTDPYPADFFLESACHRQLFSMRTKFHSVGRVHCPAVNCQLEEGFLQVNDCNIDRSWGSEPNERLQHTFGTTRSPFAVRRSPRHWSPRHLWLPRRHFLAVKRLVWKEWRSRSMQFNMHVAPDILSLFLWFGVTDDKLRMSQRVEKHLAASLDAWQMQGMQNADRPSDLERFGESREDLETTSVLHVGQVQTRL